MGIPVAIAGAGPAGLVAAIAAKQLGLEPEVVERSSPDGQPGGGILLNDNGLRVLRALGLFAPFREHLAGIKALLIRRPGGPTLFEASTAIGDAIAPPSVVMRHVLQEHLVAEVQRLGIPVHWNSVVRGCHTGPGQPRLVVDGVVETVSGVMIVGADGVNSAVRSSSGLRHRFRRTEDAFLRASSTTPAPPTAKEVWSTDGRRAGVTPITGGGSYVYLSVPPGDWEDTRHHRLLAWVRSWYELGHDIGAAVEGVSDWDAASYDVVKELVMGRWTKPPVFLVGDAAHAMQPNLGQGANSAMVDALVLIRLVAADSDLTRVAHEYEAVRRKFVRRLQRASSAAGWCARRHADPVRRLIDTGLVTASRSSSVRRRTLELVAGRNPREEAWFFDASGLDP